MNSYRDRFSRLLLACGQSNHGPNSQPPESALASELISGRREYSCKNQAFNGFIKTKISQKQPIQIVKMIFKRDLIHTPGS